MQLQFLFVFRAATLAKGNILFVFPFLRLCKVVNCHLYLMLFKVEEMFCAGHKSIHTISLNCISICHLFLLLRCHHYFAAVDRWPAG